MIFLAVGAAPSTQPAEDEVEWLLSHARSASTRPAEGTTPASQPASPLSSTAQTEASRLGTIILSDGQELRGPLTHTSGKPLRVWVSEKSEYRDVPFELVRSLRARVIWERDEKEWHFRESGSDLKEYSGNNYPARETEYVITLIDGHTVAGSLSEPLYLQLTEGARIFILHKRDKGEAGQSLKQLVYVARVELTKDEATTRP